MSEFRMPSLGADMESGNLSEWLVKPGDRVSRGQIVAVVCTDKGAIDVEIWEDGVVERLLVEPGSEVPVGTVLATLSPAAGETVKPPVETGEPPTESAKEPPLVVASRPEALPENSPAREGGGERHRASPLARKMAAQLGLDLATIKGSGPGGAIGKDDVERAATARKPAPPDLPVRRGEPVAPGPTSDGLRRAIAAAMARSNREIPHYYLKTRIDMSRSLAWLSEHNAALSARDRVLPVALLCRAVVKALQKVPELNGFWTEQGHQPSPAIHLGFTIALKGGGVLSPAIRDSQNLSLPGMMAALSDLIERARGGRLRASEMDTATITLTNLGDRGVDEVYGVIYPPQIALVGFGKILDQPWAENGMLGVRPVVSANLAGDHRATDGRTGARLLEAVNELLQNPERL